MDYKAATQNFFLKISLQSFAGVAMKRICIR